MTEQAPEVAPGDPWLTVEGVRAVLGSATGQGIDDDVLGQHLAGARAFVERHRSDLIDPDTGALVATPDVRLGTAMLAYRLYSRRESPLGVQVSGFEDGSAAPILRHDPDLERLLGLGTAGPFTFGAGTR